MTKRILTLICGTCFISIGIAFMAKADIGMSPLSTCPYVFSLLISKLTLGEWVLAWNVLFAILQIFVMGKEYKLYLLTQIPLAFLLGYFTDFAKWLIDGWKVEHYVVRLLFILIGTMFTALGVYMTVQAKLIMNGPEAFIGAIANRTGWKFGTLKSVFDGLNVVLAILLSVFVFHSIVGVREGTVFAAVFTGIFVNLYGKIVDGIAKGKNA